MAGPFRSRYGELKGCVDYLIFLAHRDWALSCKTRIRSSIKTPEPPMGRPRMTSSETTESVYDRTDNRVSFLPVEWDKHSSDFQVHCRSRPETTLLTISVTLETST